MSTRMGRGLGGRPVPAYPYCSSCRRVRHDQSRWPNGGYRKEWVDAGRNETHRYRAGPISALGREHTGSRGLLHVGLKTKGASSPPSASPPLRLSHVRARQTRKMPRRGGLQAHRVWRGIATDHPARTGSPLRPGKPLGRKSSAVQTRTAAGFARRGTPSDA